MISRHILRYMKYRVRMMRISLCTPWIWKDGKLQGKKTRVNRLFAFLFGFFMVMNILGILRFVSNQLVNVFKETDPADKEDNMLLIAFAHIMFFAMNLVTLGVHTACWKYTDELADFINSMAENDLMYQDVFKSQLERNKKNVLKERWFTEFAALGISCGTAVMPLLFGFMLVQKINPINRVLRRNFGIQPKLRNPRFIPLILLGDYLFLQGIDSGYIIIMAGLLYLRSTQFWQSRLIPENQIEDKMNGGTVSFRTGLGSKIGQDAVVKVYNVNRLLTRHFNTIFATWNITVHHICFLILTVMGLFLIFNFVGQALVPGFQLGPMAVMAAIVVEYYEAVFIDQIYETSGRYLANMKDLTKLNKRTRKQKELDRVLKALTPLRPHTGYPYFEVSRENFAEFINTTMENLVELLVSYDMAPNM